MKWKVACALLCCAVFTASAAMLHEDCLVAKYWKSLDQKEKLTFLMGYRVAKGPLLAPGEEQFAQAIKMIDEFYKDGANINVPVGGSVEIASMKLQKKSDSEINAKILYERSLIYTSF